MHWHLRFLGTIASVFLIVPASYGQLVSIDFDDGQGTGIAIDNFYDALGVSFQGAFWDDIFDGRPGTSSPLQVGSSDGARQPKAGNPIIALFSAPVDSVSISAIDVGFNDAQLDAYDSADNLVGSSTYEGLSELGNTLTAQDTSVLSVSGEDIRRIEFYQPLSVVSNDGVGFDNLTFNIVPEPGTLGLAVLTLLGFGLRIRF
ncbi:PEP-CTERM sorting domain-containing protein [Aeoliella sp.]|uniref:PEP-CTERM sorting domain-containing protein n=1 Tax=Aeoliella sp. TaxID=2795800 RepID=UPI003CCBEC67